MPTQQQIENRAKWVAALRSGDYEQDKGQLRSSKGHCCLGVAAEALDLRKDGYSYVLPSGAMQTTHTDRDWFKETFGELISDKILGKLMLMNDTENKNFSEIAEYIENGGIWAD